MDRPLERRANRPRETLLEEELRLHQRIVDRDRSAVLECLDRIGDVVYCAARRRTEDVFAAEDLIEVLFLELWGEPEKFHPSKGPIALQLIHRMPTELSVHREGVRALSPTC